MVAATASGGEEDFLEGIDESIKPALVTLRFVSLKMAKWGQILPS